MTIYRLATVGINGDGRGIWCVKNALVSIKKYINMKRPRWLRIKLIEENREYLIGIVNGMEICGVISCDEVLEIIYSIIDVCSMAVIATEEEL